jgi:hypothetical protein
MSRFALWRLRWRLAGQAKKVSKDWTRQIYEILCADQSIEP